MLEFRLLQFALIFALGLLLRWIYTLVTGNPPQSYFEWGLFALVAVGALELIKVAIADIATYYIQESAPVGGGHRQESPKTERV